MPSRPVLIGRGLVSHTPSPQQFTCTVCLASTMQFPTNNPPTGPSRRWNPELNTPSLETPPHTPSTVGACVSARVTAAIAKGKHPVPSRTRKLSLSAPMVLQPERLWESRTPPDIHSVEATARWPLRYLAEVFPRGVKSWPMTVAASVLLAMGVARRVPEGPAGRRPRAAVPSAGARTASPPTAAAATVRTARARTARGTARVARATGSVPPTSRARARPTRPCTTGPTCPRRSPGASSTAR